MNNHYDIIILGGGLVGASLALALSRSAHRIALLEHRPPRLDGLDRPDDWDARVYAISPANRRFLDELDAWPDMSRVGTVAGMDVRGDAGGRIEFDAESSGAPALTWIVENRWLLASIWQRLADAGVDVITPAEAVALDTDAKQARLTLAGGRVLAAKLIVGCDGANSWLRQQKQIGAAVDPYGHSGVVANFACELDHGGIARQWFSGDAVLAYLPLPEQRMSMVWSTAMPDELLALAPDELCRRVAEQGHHALGALKLLTPAAAFPLRLIRPETVIAERVAFAGDAAHTIHPLAGQGVNLGFGDVQLLAQLLAGAGDPGEYRLLRRYERGRLEAVRTMQLTCDGLFRLFKQDNSLVGWVRNTGLSATNAIAPLKRLLIRQAMGF